MTTDSTVRKIAVITGATSGLGEAAAEELLSRNCDLIIPCRNAEKGRSLVEKLTPINPSANIDIIPCNLLSLTSTQQCAQTIVERYPHIDLLFNNAGGASNKLRFGEDGIERTFTINHLSHFVLTLHLLPLLKQAPHARIINTSSEANYMSKPEFLDDINFDTRRYKVMTAYSDSKMANVLFTLKLARELQGENISVNCFHPGRVATNIWPETNIVFKTVFRLLKKYYFISPEQGIKPMMMLAFDPAFANSSGHFYYEMEERQAADFAYDETKQEKLWQRSIALAKDFLPQVQSS